MRNKWNPPSFIEFAILCAIAFQLAILIYALSVTF